MVRKLCIFLTLICSLLSTACQDNSKQNEIDTKQKLKNYTEEIINIVKNNSNLKIEYKNNSFNNYSVYNDRLIGINYNSDLKDFDYNLDYNISSYNINNGVIYEKNNGDLYVSLENDEFCAFKDFDETEVKIYDISGKEKCHKTYILEEKSTEILAITLVEGLVYEPNTVSKDYIQFIVTSNILDKYGCIYKWYRNDEEIENSNIENYVIPLDKENADYHLEITTPDGALVKSNIINVKIDIE